MPISEVDQGHISAFLSAVLRGKATLGMSAMPMLKIYAAAQGEGLSLPDLVMRDHDAVIALVAALKRRATALPASVVKQLESIVTLANAGE
jgi:hypothetical protein